VNPGTWVSATWYGIEGPEAWVLGLARHDDQQARPGLGNAQSLTSRMHRLLDSMSRVTWSRYAMSNLYPKANRIRLAIRITTTPFVSANTSPSYSIQPHV
jgi:hypothetical protein